MNWYDGLAEFDHQAMRGRLVGELAVACLLAVTAACSGEVPEATDAEFEPVRSVTVPPVPTSSPDSPEPSLVATSEPATSTPEPEPAAARDDWIPFVLGPISGSVPPGWSPFALTGEEFVGLAQSGLDVLDLSERSERNVEQLQTMTFDDLMLVVRANDGLSANITVLPCVPGVIPYGSWQTPEDIAEEMESGTGLNAEPGGLVVVEGEEFVMLEISASGNVASRQVLFGDRNCASFATLTPLPGDESSVEIFRTFLSVLSVKRESD